MRMVLLAVLAMALLAESARAADYTVDATHDDGDGVCLDDECTLRDALTQAGPNDRVLLPSDHTYLLDQGQLVLDGDTLVGGDARDTVIEVDSNARAVYIASGSNWITGVTITDGRSGTSQPLSGMGGGILVAFNASLILSESTVRDNAASQGGGIASNGTLRVVRSTLFDNLASTATEGSEGGGIYSAGTTTLRNSTVSGNRATSGESSDSTGAGIYVSSGSFTAENTTITGNIALANPQTGQFRNSAIYRETAFGNATVTLTRTIVAETDTFPPCEGGPFGGSNNLFFHASCGTPVDDPLLGPLELNGGKTETHEPLGDSPAIDAAGSSCPVDDQRGFARPAGQACDIGAVEVDAGEATGGVRVITQVVNDSGGTKTSFNVRLLRDGIDVNGSPAQGTTQGTDFTVPVGDYIVAGAAESGYTSSVGGACGPGGAITIGPGDEPQCVVTFDDVAQSGGGGNQPPPPPSDDDELPSPQAGENVNVLPKSGTVKVKLPGGNRFRELEEGEQLPVGTIVDTLKGRVTLVAAGGQTADFYGGIFRIGQGKGAKPLTTLTLVEKLTCPKAGKAVAAAKKKKRRLWGDGSGKFRTKGKHSAATVVGTKWLVEDKCTSTLTRVTRGRVSVRDFVKKKTVIVRAGKKYVAKARR
jgi:hypothetical protein